MFMSKAVGVEPVPNYTRDVKQGYVLYFGRPNRR